ncbi:RCC1 domain-containing protein [Paraliomyxa miuraensis]|uniref:RCC1 domain-containing protein n=1 Tax=Paraliomyxa miuraensis TaxID=376150 RepID=UPI002258851C|nr:hypothetical protein [Paraliomyxa miuraensis]MCX4242311.1 hypothetical protein [Paraliomyxa miuraensis]
MNNRNQDSGSFLSFVRGGLLVAIAGTTGIVHAQTGPGSSSGSMPEPSDAVAMMSVGDGTTCAALLDGRAKCWGLNDEGQLGRGDAEWIGDDEFPGDAAFIDVGGSVQEIHTNGRQTFALLHDGVVRAWGLNDEYQLGLGHDETIGDDETPAKATVSVDVALGGVAIDLAVGDDFACAVLEGGAVRCWGANDVGQLGLGHTKRIGDDELPADVGVVPLGGTAVRVVAGAYHACAQLVDGTARCWGANDTGQLGLGHTATIGDDETPSHVRTISLGGAVAELVAGEGHTCARLDTGAVRCWGANDAGQLGLGHAKTIGDDERPSSTLAIALGGPAIGLAAGARHTCAVLANASLVCWGEGLDGRLGLGHEDDVGGTTIPAGSGAVELGDHSASAVFIGATGSSTCAKLDGGAARCWGLDYAGQLGQAHTQTLGARPTTTPDQIPDIIVAHDDDD